MTIAVDMGRKATKTNKQICNKRINVFFLVLMFGKPECDVLQPEPHCGEACNTLSHKGLTNVNIQKGMLYCHCYIL